MKKISKEDFDYLVCCANHYDPFTHYIDSFRQQEQAEEMNACWSGEFDEVLAGLGLKASIRWFANLGTETASKIEAWLSEQGVEVEKPAKRVWTEEEEERKMKKEYKYGMRLRGFSPGCQPMKGLIRREDDPFEDYWDVLVYNRKLEESEIQQYELDRIK